jgi:hypothetical protein
VLIKESRINQKTNVMKNNWKKVSTALMILAATATLQAASPVLGTNPGEKEIKENSTTLQVKGLRVFVNHLNLMGHAVTLKVYDEENRLLYIQEFDETPVIEKAFNFENAYRGTYSVLLSDEDTTYAASVTVAL